MDTVDKRTRSRIMASVGRSSTGPELRLRHSLHKIGFRYRINDRRLPGSPDLVFPRFKAVVFVHGCFWHAHRRCKFATIPSSKIDFWRNKFKENRRRDRKNYTILLKNGWRVSIVWECAIKAKSDIEIGELALELGNWLKSSYQFAEFSGNEKRLV